MEEDLQYQNPIFEHFHWDAFLEEVEDILAEAKEQERQQNIMEKDIPWDYEPDEEDLAQYLEQQSIKEYEDKVAAGEDEYDDDLNPDPAKYLSDEEKKIYKQCKDEYKECNNDCPEICENLALWGNENEEEALERVSDCHVGCKKKCKIVKNFCLLDQGITTVNQDGTKL